jgi:hypothetical protein
MHNASYCDVVRHQGTWRKVARWLTLVNLSEVAVTQAGTVARVEYWPEFTRGAIFLTLLRYPTAPSMNHYNGRESGRTVAGGELSELAI